MFAYRWCQRRSRRYWRRRRLGERRRRNLPELLPELAAAPVVVPRRYGTLGALASSQKKLERRESLRHRETGSG